MMMRVNFKIVIKGIVIFILLFGGLVIAKNNKEVKSTKEN